MTSSLEMNNNVFHTQPNQQEINPQIATMLEQFGGRVERLTAHTLSPAERAIVDARLLKLEIAIGALEADHKNFIGSAMNDALFAQAA